MNAEAIQIKVIPGSSRNQVKMIGANIYKVWTTEQPEKGKANRKVIGLLAEYLDVPKSEVHLVKGEGSQNKLVIIGDNNE